MFFNPFHESPSLLTRGQRFLDPQGRQVILHGINLVHKDRSKGYLGDVGPRDFANMRRWGFNCIRLGVIWDGLEPQPGVYNETYLQGLDRQIALARENGLYVFLDMHQDLYSSQFGDGAPEWATITDGQQHVTGAVWSDAYFSSPAVQTAQDHFWANSLAPDGLGLQDHYARAWQVLARRYKNEPAVIGYDLLNEPFPGSRLVQAQMVLMLQGAQLLTETFGPDAPSLEQLAAQWMDPDGRYELLKLLDDPELYCKIIDSTQLFSASFEQECLQPMFQRVADAIRAEDQDHIIFIQGAVSANMGIYSAIRPLTGVDGQPDPQQAYAPHGYDLVVDTVHTAKYNPARVRVIFTRHGETARRLDLPLLVGEWGAFYRTNADVLPAARSVVDQFEQLLSADTYWDYEPDLDSLPAFKAVSRPYPERIAGVLQSYCYDPQQQIFECEWQEDGQSSAPTRIYLPAWIEFSPSRLALDSHGLGWRVEPVEQGGVWLEVLLAGYPVNRRLIYRG